MKAPVQGFWGKLEVHDGALIGWHPLVDHCADVAACCEALLQETLLGSRLAILAEQNSLSPVQIARLGVLAALHDIGKFNIGFQNKALEAPPFKCGHLAEVLGLLDTSKGYALTPRLHDAIAANTLDAWGDSVLELLTATISHHGRPIGLHAQIDPAWWSPARGLDPLAGVADLVERTRSWFPDAWRDAADPLPESAAFQHAWSGLVMLADWIGSDAERFFPFSEDRGAERMPLARRAASDALQRLGLAVHCVRRSLGVEPPGFERIAPDLKPRPAQAALLELSPKKGEGSVAVLEAETGAGKTEAALAYFVRLLHAGLVDGLYFALPTRTAATQIYRRVCAAVCHAFPQGQRPPVVLAVPGYLEVDGIGGVRLPHFRVLWGDDRAERRYRGWAAEHPKRYLAGVVAVGTVDQALLSALKVSHAHMRSTALLRHLLVVDEVHASDAYMTRILEEVLDHHLAAGGHALLMSATLGAGARERLLTAKSGSSPTVPPISAAIARAYPLVSFRQGTDSRELPVAAEDALQKRLELHLIADLEDPEAIARRGLAAARDGARVLVVRNTIAGCVATQIALETLASRLGEEGLLFRCRAVAAPHHARFARSDRTLLDDALEAAFGKARPHAGRVVVATQTVQQSLDLDADLLITDLCPMDVLLQRIGRLHRHQRPRPRGYEIARVLVLTPASPLASRIGRAGAAAGSHGLGSVYDDLRVLEATWRTLIGSPQVTIPAENRRLVESATHPEVLTELVTELGGPWIEHQRYVLGSVLSDRRLGALNLVRRDLPFGHDDVEFPSGETAHRIPTRLGDQDRLVRFEPPIHGPFSTSREVSELTLPVYLVAPATPADAAVAEEVVDAGSTTTFSFGPRTYRYDRLGLRPDQECDDCDD